MNDILAAHKATHTEPIASSEHARCALESLWQLARDTFGLWSHKRVGFSWRHYYLEHTVRVRNLCLALAQSEEADATCLEFAALLHDITKRFDGPFLVGPSGQRMVDSRGFWMSEPALPDTGQANIVTRLYHFYDEFGRPHSESGADIARTLLLLEGLPPGLAQKAADIVRAHLQPIGKDASEDYLTLEQQILCDADMLDSNLGLVAFYRNVQIHTHRRIEESGSADLKAYVEHVPKWLDMKEAFLPKVHTTTAQRLAAGRLARCREFHDLMSRESEDWDTCERFGLLSIFKYFTSTVADPDFFRELHHLQSEHLPRLRSALAALAPPQRQRASAAIQRGERFCDELRQEADGRM